MVRDRNRHCRCRGIRALALNPMKTRYGGRLPALAIGAVGIVFGDIGTSPLYAFSQCFSHDFLPTPRNVLGILSLIVWALVVVVCIKYVTFMMRADYDGEGGILALLAQVAGAVKDSGTVALSAVTMVALFGGAALYGDGIITPAISVISAIEGLDVWTTAAHRFIVPVSLLVLIALFAVQHRGTGRIGKFFGPVMLVWFFAIAAAGCVAVVKDPQVLRAFNPIYGIAFFTHNGVRSLLIFGAVVLCVTGAEALYADLAHFGRIPITIAWYAAVFPALLMNYLGQGAHALASPGTLQNSFYSLYPPALIVPMVVLSTIATVIASQALISGAFSLTHQATQLGFAPRFRTVHTSRREGGQIFLPSINLVLAIGCIALVVTFRSSAALASAYGLAVSITMIATTVAFAALTRRRYRWPLWQSIVVVGVFLVFDIPFLVGNISKIASGGWLPLSIAIALFTLFVTWNRGRRRLMQFLFDHSIPLAEFAHLVRQPAAEGTAVLFTADGRGIPETLRDWWMTEHIPVKTVVLLTISGVSRPYIADDDRVQVELLTPALVRVRACYGFMQQARIGEIVTAVRRVVSDVHPAAVTYYLAAPSIVEDQSKKRLPKWQRMLYVFMSRNARSHTDSLGLPVERVIRFGVRVPI